jgi:hypothetical protein
VFEFFWGVVDMGGNNSAVILVDKVVVYNFEVAVRIDENLRGVEGDDGFELAEGIGAGLQDAP